MRCADTTAIYYSLLASEYVYIVVPYVPTCCGGLFCGIITYGLLSWADEFFPPSTFILVGGEF